MNYAELQAQLIAARIADVQRLRSEGWTMREIANELGISVGQVHADCHAGTPAQQLDDEMREAAWQTRADADEFDEVQDFDAFVRQAARHHDDDEEPQGTRPASTPDPAPTSSQQMDDWLRSPAARRGTTVTGRHPGDDFLHDLADRTETARRRRMGANLQGDTP